MNPIQIPGNGGKLVNVLGIPIYIRVRGREEEKGIQSAFLRGLNGYYAFLAMIMNVAGTPAPDGAEPLLPIAATLGSDPHG